MKLEFTMAELRIVASKVTEGRSILTKARIAVASDEKIVSDITNAVTASGLIGIGVSWNTVDNIVAINISSELMVDVLELGGDLLLAIFKTVISFKERASVFEQKHVRAERHEFSN